MQIRLARFTLRMLCIPALGSYAQQDAAHLLKGLSEQAAEYQRMVPSFTCSESVTTTAKQGDKLLRRLEFQGDLQVRRKEDKSLDESFSMTSYMGKPVPKNAKLPLIMYLTGGLAGGAISFFDERVQACFDSHAVGDRIELQGDPKNAGHCDESIETKGSARLDPEGKLVRGEFHRPEAEAVRAKKPTTSYIEYADVRLDGKLFRLPSHVYAEIVQKGILRTFDAYYTGCKLFTAKTTIRPGDGMAESDSP